MSNLFSRKEEEQNITLKPSHGTIPDELKGDYIKNGPGQFSAGATDLEHWFDGLSLIRRFRFVGNEVHFSSSYLKSETYQDALKLNRLNYAQFSMPKPLKWWQYFSEIIRGRQSGHNSNVNVCKIAGRYFAMTESKGITEFNIDTLETGDVFYFDDKLDQKSILTSAHPVYDPVNDKWINFEICPGTSFTTTFYEINNKTLARNIIGSTKTSNLSYVHAFAATESYLIHVESPAVTAPIPALIRFSFVRYAKMFKWQPERRTKISLINRSTGEIDCITWTDPLFIFHFGNAWEQDGQVIFDFVHWPNYRIIHDLYLEKLKNTNGRPISDRSSLTRCHVTVNSGVTNFMTLCNDYCWEFPVFNHDYYLKPHQYTYGLTSDRDSFDNALIKIDTHTSRTLLWSETKVFAGEPVFIKKENALREDDGYLLSLVIGDPDKNFLLVLDAKSFDEVCRVPVPGALTPGFHGVFYPRS